MSSEGSLREQFNKVVAEKIRPAMKRKGFSCSQNRIWNRKKGRLTDVIEIQTSSHSTSSFFSFTLNIGIVSSEVDEIIWDKKDGVYAREIKGLLRLRAGDIVADVFSDDIPKKTLRDVWWNVDSVESIEKIVDEIYGLMTTKIIDFLDHITSFEELEVFLSTHEKILRLSYSLPKMKLGVLRVLLGKKEEGKKLLMEIIKSGDVWANRALGALKRLGLEQNIDS